MSFSICDGSLLCLLGSFTVTTTDTAPFFIKDYPKDRELHVNQRDNNTYILPLFKDKENNPIIIIHS